MKRKRNELERRYKIIEHIDRVSSFTLPFYNAVEDVFYIQNENCHVLKYDVFCALLDKSDITPIDNFDGDYETLIKHNNTIYILSSTCLTYYNNKQTSVNLKAYDDYHVYKNIIVFYSKLDKKIHIFDLTKLDYILHIDSDIYPVINVYEDRVFHKIKVFVILNFLTKVEIREYSIDKNININIYYEKLKYYIYETFLINENKLLCRTEFLTYLLDLTSKNKLQMTFLDQNILETKYLDGIHSLYIRVYNYGIIIHRSNIEKLKDSTISMINKLIEDERSSLSETSLSIIYDTCIPIFSYTHDLIIYINDNKLYVQKTIKDRRILLMKELDDTINYYALSFDDNNDTIYLTTLFGDLLSFTL